MTWKALRRQDPLASVPQRFPSAFASPFLPSRSLPAAAHVFIDKSLIYVCLHPHIYSMHALLTHDLPMHALRCVPSLCVLPFPGPCPSFQPSTRPNRGSRTCICSHIIACHAPIPRFHLPLAIVYIANATLIKDATYRVFGIKLSVLIYLFSSFCMILSFRRL